MVPGSHFEIPAGGDHNVFDYPIGGDTCNHAMTQGSDALAVLSSRALGRREAFYTIAEQPKLVHANDAKVCEQAVARISSPLIHVLFTWPRRSRVDDGRRLARRALCEAAPPRSCV